MDLGTDRIKRVSITDEVVNRLRDSIRQGKIEVGGKLPTESELQASLGVGRSTVREALRMLQAMGLIEMKSGRGAFVRKSSNASLADWVVENEALLNDMMEVRTAVEVLAARLACEKGTDGQLRDIADACDAFLTACAEGNTATLTGLDENFHNAVFAASNNVFLKQLSEVLSESLRSYRNRSFANDKLATRAAVPHRRILEAILARDSSRAAAAMRTHLEMSLRDLTLAASQSLEAEAGGNVSLGAL